MLEKSIAAMVSAIEVYNKPDFRYREETFSVLCVNAWELLLKAKVVHLSGNKLTSIFVWEQKTLRDGTRSKKKYRRLNRAGNPMSVGLFETYRIISEDYGVKISSAVRDNLETLVEIRDNAVHFVNDDLQLALKIQEIGTASLQNFLHLCQDWFSESLDHFNFYLMPLSFIKNFDSVAGELLNASERKLLRFIKEMEKPYDEDDIKDYNVTLRVDVRFQKVKSTSGLMVQITKDPNAPKVRLSEEDIMDRYPWDYEILTTRLKKRYSDFKVNRDYHELRKKFSKDSRYCHERLYNPTNPKSGTKQFFNANIVKEFDRHYQRMES